MTDVLDENRAAEWLREPVTRLRAWRVDDAGPNCTELRNGSATYTLRDLKIFLRQQMDRRKTEQIE